MDQTLEKQWFCQNIESMRRAVFRVAFALLQNTADCEDAASAASLTAYEKLYQLKDQKNFRAWFMRILKNECMALLRKRKKVLFMEKTAPATYSEPIPDIDLNKALMGLREEYRVAIILYHLEGVGIEEIAVVLGVPAGTVKSWLFRARAQLKEKLMVKEV